MKNIDKKVVEDFGEEWDRFRQSNISKVDLKMAWDQYFSIFPFEKLNSNSVGFDMVAEVVDGLFFLHQELAS